MRGKKWRRKKHKVLGLRRTISKQQSSPMQQPLDMEFALVQYPARFQLCHVHNGPRSPDFDSFMVWVVEGCIHRKKFTGPATVLGGMMAAARIGRG